jgi:hypothetical protein
VSGALAEDSMPELIVVTSGIDEPRDSSLQIQNVAITHAIRIPFRPATATTR